MLRRLLLLDVDGRLELISSIVSFVLVFIIIRLVFILRLVQHRGKAVTLEFLTLYG